MTELQRSIREYVSNNMTKLVYNPNDDGGRSTFTIGPFKSSLFSVTYQGQELSTIVNSAAIFFHCKMIMELSETVTKEAS